jgi:hypothetical protein
LSAQPTAVSQSTASLIDRPNDNVTVRSELDPAADARVETGIAWISVSTPKISQGSGRTACRHRAIPGFPELEPPLRTIT